jgi:hypothetical protein
VVIVLTVTILVFRVMRVTFTEWIGDAVPPVRNTHVSSIDGAYGRARAHRHVGLPMADVRCVQSADGGAEPSCSGGWLKSENRNPTYALVPMIFMYVTTLAATIVTARNLYVTIAANPTMTGLPVAGAWAMIAVSALLFLAALMIGWDGYKAYLRYRATHAGQPQRPVAAPPPGE